MTAPEPTLIEFGELTPQLRAELEGSEYDPYDMAGVYMDWQPKPRHVGLLDPQGQLIASTGLVIARIEVDGRGLDVLGLGGVIVARPHRGRGLARRVVGAALELGATLGPDIAMLFCREDRVGLYERLGFSEVPRPVRVTQRDGSQVVMPLVTMWRALEPRTILPRGLVRLLTLPF